MGYGLDNLECVAKNVLDLKYSEMEELARDIYTSVDATLENHGERDQAAREEFDWNFFAQILIEWAEEYTKKDEESAE